MKCKCDIRKNLIVIIFNSRKNSPNLSIFKQFYILLVRFVLNSENVFRVSEK